MSYEDAPLPQSSGALDPPRRVPPVATDTMELPPERPRRERYPVWTLGVRRAALAMLAFLLFVAGLTVLAPLGWRAAVGAALVVAAMQVAHRAGARGERPSDRASARRVDRRAG